MSDIDEESDVEILKNNSKPRPRVGSNIVLPNEPLLDEEEIEHQPNQEEPIPQSIRQPKTRKADITWRRHLEFNTPQFTWIAPLLVLASKTKLEDGINYPRSIYQYHALS